MASQKYVSYWVALVICLLVGFALRIYQLDVVPLRGDEAFSVSYWTELPLGASLREIASIEPHPPLTYVLFRAWGLLIGTDNAFGLRMLPVLFSTLGIAGIAALGQRLGGRRVALLAALLWALHPFQIWHAQDFRNYAIWAGLSTLSLYFGIRVLAEREPKAWLIYSAVALTSSLIFYMELLTVGVLTLYSWLRYWRERRLAMRWTVLQASIIAITVAAFLILQGALVSSGGYGGTTGSFTLSQWWTRFLPVLNFGDTLSAQLQLELMSDLWPILLLLLVGAWGVVWRWQRNTAFLLALLGIVPLLMLGIISTQLNIFRPRYVMLAAPAYILTIAIATNRLWQQQTWQGIARLLATALITFWIGASLVSLANYFADPAFRKAPNWPALVRYLADNTQAGEAIIQTGVDAGFGYYYQRADVPAAEFGLPADVTQPIPDVITAMEATADRFDTIWIVGRTFPDWPNTGVVEEWAFENLQLVRETSIAGLPVRQFKQWQVAERELADTPPLANFEDVIALRGVKIFPPEPTNTLTIWIYWQPLAQTDDPLTTFTHLIGATNPATGTPLWSQDDQPPLDGIVSPTNWEVGNLYRDVFVLPLADVVAADYELVVGLYNPDTAQRLMIETGADAIFVGEITLE